MSQIPSGGTSSGDVTKTMSINRSATLTAVLKPCRKVFSVSSNENTSTGNKSNDGTSPDNKNAMAIGPGTAAQADDALAIGNNTKSTGAGSIAIGSEGPIKSTDPGDSTHLTEAKGERSVSIGSGSIAQTDHSIAIGTRATNYNQVNEIMKVPIKGIIPLRLVIMPRLPGTAPSQQEIRPLLPAMVPFPLVKNPGRTPAQPTRLRWGPAPKSMVRHLPS